ncbi:MAG: hypothetical protein ABI175_21655, partial [Polyangiales bacterium]
MTASCRVSPHTPGRWLAAVCALVGLGVLVVPSGCAGGGDDPGVAPDRCKARDCGPSSGGLDGDKLDGDEEEFDTEFPPEEDTAIADTRKPGVDTALSDTPIDSAVTDTAVDSAKADTAPPGDTATCTIPTGKTCGWSPQCGCTTGQNCDFTSTDGSVACVAAGTVDRNGKCTALGQCKKGLTCVAGL